MENKSKDKVKQKKYILIAACVCILAAALITASVFFLTRSSGKGTAYKSQGIESDGQNEGDETESEVSFYPAESDVLTYDKSFGVPEAPSGYKKTETALEGVDLGYGLTLLSVGSYTGRYTEDGSDEYVNNVMSVTVRNDGEQDIQMATVLVSLGDIFCEFRATTFPKNSVMVILEKNRHTLDEDSVIKYANAENIIYFANDVSLCSDTVSVTAKNGYLNISNISDKDIEGELTLYYKSCESGQYFGGITYFVSAKDGVAAGDSVTLPASHFIPGKSKIMFVVYDK